MNGLGGGGGGAGGGLPKWKWNFARTKNVISSFLGDDVIKTAEIWPKFLIFKGIFGRDQKYTSRLI